MPTLQLVSSPSGPKPGSIPSTGPDFSPEILRALRARGVAVGPAMGPDLGPDVGPDVESRAGSWREDRERALETALMAIFRDTGSNLAFEALYRCSHRSLMGWIIHILAGAGQAGDPAELMQDTYVNVYRYAGGFREGAGRSFRGWARTIAVNVVRRARRRRALSLQEMPMGVGEPEDQRAGPELSALLGEERESIGRAWSILLLFYAQAFQQLSPRDRQALTLVEVDGLSYAEAGERLGVGRSNMKMIMFRSRKRIRAHMQRAMRFEETVPLRAVG